MLFSWVHPSFQYPLYKFWLRINDSKIRYDTKKLNGTPRKVLDISLAKKYGWYPKTELTDAILKTYDHFLKIEKWKKKL